MCFTKHPDGLAGSIEQQRMMEDLDEVNQSEVLAALAVWVVFATA